jgi:hypothetical protein
MGIGEVLRDGVGCLIAEDDEQDFAAKVVRLLSEPALRAELRARARPYAQSWSSPVMAQRMLALYQRVCAGDAGTLGARPTRRDRAEHKLPGVIDPVAARAAAKPAVESELGFADDAVEADEVRCPATR